MEVDTIVKGTELIVGEELITGALTVVAIVTGNAELYVIPAEDQVEYIIDTKVTNVEDEGGDTLDTVVTGQTDV